MPDSRIIETTRPATVVTPVIKIDGAEIPRTYQVETIVINNELNRIPWAKVVLIDGSASAGQFPASNDSLFIPGKKITVECGYQNDNYPIYKGIIVKHSLKLRTGGSKLMIECRDQAAVMTLVKKSRYYGEVTDSDALNTILGSYSGLTATIEDTSVKHKKLVQYESTDWDFMLSRAEANSLLIHVDGSEISLSKPDLGQEAALTLTFGATIQEMDAEIDARLQFNTVKSRSWNPADQEIIEEDAADPGISLNGNLSVSDLADVFNAEDLLLNHGGAVPQPEIKAWADAVKQKQELSRVRGRVRFKGIHTLKPGMLVQLDGLSDRFNGKAFVNGIQHQIAGGEWQLDAQLGADPEWFAEKNVISSPPASALVPSVHGLQIGLVTQLENDPEGECRIMVRLPVINPDEQGIWARLATLDAGNNRGSFFLPEIGDEVIVGFINDDPREAVVLGMLNSSNKPAPLTASDSNPQKGLVTRSGIKMLFDDDKKIYLLETPAGKKITLDEDAGIIGMEDENQNKLTFDSNGISIESQGKITVKAVQDLELQGLNVKANASATMEAKGSASAEFSSSGATTLKGSIVQIN